MCIQGYTILHIRAAVVGVGLRARDVWYFYSYIIYYTAVVVCMHVCSVTPICRRRRLEANCCIYLVPLILDLNIRASRYRYLNANGPCISAQSGTSVLL